MLSEAHSYNYYCSCKLVSAILSETVGDFDDGICCKLWEEYCQKNSLLFHNSKKGKYCKNMKMVDLANTAIIVSEILSKTIRDCLQLCTIKHTNKTVVCVWGGWGYQGQIAVMFLK